MKVPFWKLLVAYAIDCCIISLCARFLWGAVITSHIFEAQGAVLLTPLAMLFSPLLFALYFATTQAIWHTTLGKILLGIRAQQNLLSSITFGTLFIYFLSFLWSWSTIWLQINQGVIDIIRNENILRPFFAVSSYLRMLILTPALLTLAERTLFSLPAGDKELTETSFERPNFGQILGMYFIDLVFGLVLFLIVSLFCFVFAAVLRAHNNEFIVLLAGTGLVFLLVFSLYFVVMDKLGATIGKLIMDVRVVSSQTGKRAPIGKLFVGYAMNAAWAIPVALCNFFVSVLLLHDFSSGEFPLFNGCILSGIFVLWASALFTHFFGGLLGWKTLGIQVISRGLGKKPESGTPQG